MRKQEPAPCIVRQTDRDTKRERQREGNTDRGRDREGNTIKIRDREREIQIEVETERGKYR